MSDQTSTKSLKSHDYLFKGVITSIEIDSMFTQYYEEHTFDKRENVREGEKAFMSS